MVVLQAFAGAPVPADTVWTDGSFGGAGAGAGAAAAIQPSTRSSLTCRLCGLKLDAFSSATTHDFKLPATPGSAAYPAGSIIHIVHQLYT